MIETSRKHEVLECQELAALGAEPGRTNTGQQGGGITTGDNKRSWEFRAQKDRSKNKGPQEMHIRFSRNCHYCCALFCTTYRKRLSWLRKGNKKEQINLIYI